LTFINPSTIEKSKNVVIKFNVYISSLINIISQHIFNSCIDGVRKQKRKKKFKTFVLVVAL